MTRARKLWLLFTIIISGAMLPVSCVPMLFACNTLIPIGLAFQASFSVRNQSGELIYITPIGVTETRHIRAVLPVTLSNDSTIPEVRSREFAIPNGESVDITYDADDINFTEIMARTESGEYFSKTTNPNPNEHVPPLASEFVIGSTSTLEKPTAEMIHAAKQGRWPRWGLILAIVFGLVNPFLFQHQLRAYRGSALHVGDKIASSET